jgi:hypothetical protein
VTDIGVSRNAQPLHKEGSRWADLTGWTADERDVKPSTGFDLVRQGDFDRQPGGLRAVLSMAMNQVDVLFVEEEVGVPV